MKFGRGVKGKRLTNEGRELVGVGGEWKFPLVETGGHADGGCEASSS